MDLENRFIMQITKTSFLNPQGAERVFLVYNATKRSSANYLYIIIGKSFLLLLHLQDKSEIGFKHVMFKNLHMKNLFQHNFYRYALYGILFNLYIKHKNVRLNYI